jgi:hypothetical protein
VTPIVLSGKERALLKTYADSEGLTEEEAASKLISQALARRVKRNTGKTAAKVYPLKKP